MKLLRHETGHALNYAYKLYKKRKWQKIFGPFSAEYDDHYRLRPYSKSFVRNLEDYYAQYHPDEDFAETFAVWLTPHINWQKQYTGWKAMEKLNYVDEVMNSVKTGEPLVPRGKKFWQASRIRKTLKNFYKSKRHLWAEYFPDFHDQNLKRIFIASEEKRKRNSQLPYADDILRKYKKDIQNSVSRWTGEKKFIIDDLLTTIIQRCRALNLLAMGPEQTAVLRVSTYVTTLVMNYMYTGQFRGEE
jgi:hypothetical protein